MIEDKNIESRFGGKSPFTVPEGYFDNLTARVMNNLPQQTKVVELKPKKHNYWKEIATVAAACVAGVVVFLNVHTTNDVKLTADNQQVVYDEQYQQDMMEYAMIDANDVYTYLSDGGY